MRLFASILLTLLSVTLFASNARYRVMFRDDPSTTACIGWDQTGGSNPIVYYDVVDHGTNYSAYANSQTVSRTSSYKGMNNHFARLTGLQPNTAYYFVIRDSQGTSQRFWFKTCPNNSNERLSFVAGGDSRNNATPRRNANKLVAKLRPHAVFFGGDMTNGDSNSEWLEWMNDWQLSIASDGRMTPFVAARGNHENGNASVYNLFDTPSSNVYYAITFGGNLIRTYTLNTEISISGSQTTWLNNDLAANQNTVWKMAQYHKPMRPHVSSKSEGNNQYNNWAVPFRQNNVKLVVECDAHTVKTTWPVVPSTGGGSDEGFIRDDVNGTVYVGEGCWGAPLRSNNDSKNWTRNSGQFNQFKWIFVDNNKIEVRTIRVDNADQVGSVSDANIFTAPSNLDIWNPSNGSVVTIQGTGGNFAPTVSLTAPTNGTHYGSAQFVTTTATASDSDGSIDRVEFLVDGNVEFTDYSAPYSASVYIADGSHTITAKAYDNEGANDTETINVTAGAYSQTFETRINSSMDDVEENANGSMYTNSSDIELVADGSRGNQVIGLRWNGINIPQGATIDNAYIQFTCDETNTGSTNLTIRGHDVNNSGAFTTSTNNVSNRSTTSASVSWNPASWNAVGAAGSNERTPNLTSIVQEIVNRSGWASNNSMSMIITGTGERTAEAYDGTSGSAALLHIEYTVGGTGNNQAPSVSITAPQNGATITANLNDQFALSASASDADGTVSKVDFYRGGTLIGTDNSAPFSINASVTGFGNFSYTAVATDNDGASTTSSAISVTINENQTGNCGTTVTSYPYVQGFENTLGAWSQVNGDDLNWTLRSGTTPSSNTGPSSAFAGTYYVYVETSSPNYPSKVALLESPCFDLSGIANAELTFRYHMLGNAVGTLSLEVSTNEGASWSSIWSRTGDQGSAWNEATVDISAYANAKFRLRGLSGTSWQGDLCVDEFRIQSAAANQAPNVSITSPTNGAQIDANLGDAITLSASASDVDGNVTSVQFFRNGSSIGTDNSAPFSINTTVPGFGGYTYSVVATDNDGATTTSPEVSVTFNQIVGSTCGATIVSYPYVQGFENTLGNWSQATGDDLNWTLRSGNTPSNNTGPSGAAAGTYYVYVETSSPNYPSKLALLESPCFNLSSLTNAELSFRYHMLGNAVGTLSLEVSTNEGSTWTSIWSRSTDQGSSWNTAIVDISSYANAKFRLSGLSGTSWQGDLCVDDFRIQNAAGGGGMQSFTFDKRVTTGNDDAEEGESGAMYLNSSDLELVYDSYNSQGNQQVGIRFTGITIPQGATITSAYIQFTTDETANDAGSKTIYGQDVNDAATFSTASNNISNRTKTSASVSWNPTNWTSVGAAGAAQRTSDLATIVQEIVDRSGWSSGNDMVFIVTGTGRRTAESYNGSSSQAPLLHVEYEAPGVKVADNFDVLDHHVHSYPNPVTDILTISNSYDEVLSVQIVDESGIVHRRFMIEAKSLGQTIVEDLKPGAYVISVTSGTYHYYDTFIKK